MFGLNLYLHNSLSSGLKLNKVPKSQSPLRDPFMPFIGCIIQSDQVNACRIYNWEDSAPEIDGQNQKVFLKFKSSSTGN